MIKEKVQNIKAVIDITTTIDCDENGQGLLKSGQKMTAFIFRKAKQSGLEDIICLLADDQLGKQRGKLSVTIPSNYLDSFISTWCVMCPV